MRHYGLPTMYQNCLVILILEFNNFCRIFCNPFFTFFVILFPPSFLLVAVATSALFCSQCHCQFQDHLEKPVTSSATVGLLSIQELLWNGCKKEFKNLKSLLNFWMPDRKDPFALKIGKKRDLNASSASCNMAFSCINGRTMLVCSCWGWQSSFSLWDCHFSVEFGKHPQNIVTYARYISFLLQEKLAAVTGNSNGTSKEAHRSLKMIN